MNVVEPARLFEHGARAQLPPVSYISSRICGICSASHVVTDLKAIERLRVQVTPRTRAHRELLVCSSYLQNHATVRAGRARPWARRACSRWPETDPELFDTGPGPEGAQRQALHAVGGRSIHPITAVIGRLHSHELEARGTRWPEDEQATAFAATTVDLFASFPCRA